MSDVNVPGVNVSGLSDNAAGGLSYVTIIPAIVFLIVEPFKKSSYVRFHAWQSIFFYVAWAVVHILVEVVQNLVPTVVFLTLSLVAIRGSRLLCRVGDRVRQRFQRQALYATNHWRTGGEAG